MFTFGDDCTVIGNIVFWNGRNDKLQLKRSSYGQHGYSCGQGLSVANGLNRLIPEIHIVRDGSPQRNAVAGCVHGFDDLIAGDIRHIRHKGKNHCGITFRPVANARIQLVNFAHIIVVVNAPGHASFEANLITSEHCKGEVEKAVPVPVRTCHGGHTDNVEWQSPAKGLDHAAVNKIHMAEN